MHVYSGSGGLPMICMRHPRHFVGEFLPNRWFEFKPDKVRSFVNDVSAHLSEPSSELAGCIARIDDRHFVGGKYDRVIQQSLQTLRSLCACWLGRKVSDPEVLSTCLCCLCSSCHHSFNTECMFNTKKMSPYEPMGDQNKAAWLMLKAALSIDIRYAAEVVCIVRTTMPDLMGVLGVFSLMMQTEFGVALFKCKVGELSMPVAQTVLSSPSMMKVLTNTLEKLGENRSQTYEPAHESKDPWLNLAKHILNTTEMAEAVICRRNMTTIAVLRIVTNEGFRCLARRMNYNGGVYFHWARQCSKDLTDELRSVLTRKNAEIKVLTGEELDAIQAQKSTDGWWSVTCMDDASSSNMQVARDAMKRQNSFILSANGVFTGLVAVSFVSFVE